MITFFEIDFSVILDDDVSIRDLLVATESDCRFKKPKPGSADPNVINMVQ